MTNESKAPHIQELVTNKKAFFQFKHAAEAGNSSGQNVLGFCYEYGKGVEIDLQKALELYQKSAKAGNSTGQFNLAICYENGKGAEMVLETGK